MDAHAPAVAVALALLATHAAPELQFARTRTVVLAPALDQRRTAFGAVARAAGQVLPCHVQQRFVVCHHGFAASLAQAPHQALRKDGEQRIREVERVQADLQQPRNALGCRIGVQGGEHQMPCERCFNGDARGFLVAHFADHDDVWVRA